ncbi:GNAT family N-acetyltransferase [Candidatus Latescibacterota bacterium]
MVLDLVPAKPEHVSELGRILYEAFKDIADRHHFPPLFQSTAFARKAIGWLVERSDIYGVTALVDGQPVGSNFMELTDEVAGVLVISVDVPFQGRGIGRALMEDVLNHARRNNFEKVRLLQESHNVASLSLYASLGFDTKEAVAFMRPVALPDESVRSITETDLPVIKQLSKRIYKVSRHNEVAGFIQWERPSLVREREGRVTGYFIPGRSGHGVAETEEDALTLIGEAANRYPNEDTCFLCPLSQGSFYRNALKTGCMTIEVVNLMAVGPYEPPDEVWMPSVVY